MMKRLGKNGTKIACIYITGGKSQNRENREETFSACFYKGHDSGLINTLI